MTTVQPPAAAPPLSGRRAQAARNDQAILEAARAVFMRDPGAPMAVVAQEAGVGVGGLYRRYANKDQLLQTLCREGLQRFIAAGQHAAARDDDPWSALAGFVTEIVESDVHALTVHLAGTFTPSPDLRDLAIEASRLATEVFDRAAAAGVLRDGLVVDDLTMLFEQLTAVRLADAERTRQLRRRYLAVQLDGLRADRRRGPLPGPAPTADELHVRWERRPGTAS